MKEVVLGLHWDPPLPVASGKPVDLDALCVIYDADNAVLDVIDSTHPRSADGSIVHTGDSRTGSSTWDDERIFVFLDALPSAVSRLAFVVASVSGHSFDEVPGALCHLSDRTTEAEWMRLDLTSLAGRMDCIVAIVNRVSSGWSITTEMRPVAEALPAEVKALLQRTKRPGAPFIMDREG